MRSVARSFAGVLLVAATVAAACDSGTGRPSPGAHPPPPSPAVTASAGASTPPSPAVVASACPRTAEWGPTTNLPERQGVGRGATLWALFFPESPTLTAGQELKVVWRMTGQGDFSIGATGPTGAVIRPVWGPDPHPSSSWSRPGEEWGTGWVFPTAGCWTLTARRDTATGYLVLRVAAAKP